MDTEGDSHTLTRWFREGRRDDFFWLRVVGGSTGLALAVVAVVTDGVHGPFLILAGVAAFVFAFPWQRLSALRAGPFEFSLEQGQIKDVVDSIQVGGEEEDRLPDLLARLGPDIERARGSRVLWVEDRPLRVLAERRLLRALGIETVLIPFSRDAVETLRYDNDFDLVITSLLKPKDREAIKDELGNDALRDKRMLGVLFVRWLRGDTSKDSTVNDLYGEENKDTVVSELRVLFYVAATSKEEMIEKTLPVAGLGPGIELSGEFEEFLKKTIRLLADVRADPIVVPVAKEA